MHGRSIPLADIDRARNDRRDKQLISLNVQQRSEAPLSRQRKQAGHPLPRLQTENTFRRLASRDVRLEQHWIFW